MDGKSAQPGAHLLTEVAGPPHRTRMQTMHAYVSGVGVCAPGLGNWAVARAVLTGRASFAAGDPPRLDRTRLPAKEARRAPFAARLALQVAYEALDYADTSLGRLASVFACSGGNTEALDRVMAALCEPERLVSPQQFANVGHNAPSGLWSMTTATHAPSTSIAAFDGSFAAGLIEATSQARFDGAPVLLVAYDVPPPDALAAARPVDRAFAAALLLTAEPWARSVCRLDLRDAGGAPEEAIAAPELEELRSRNPAARSLPLLRLIARQTQGSVVLPYVARRRLLVDHRSC